jgi:hypothetical protein
MIRAAFWAERRRQAHARAKIRTSAPRTKVQECPPSFDPAGCVIAATGRDACSASCWRPCEELIAGRLSWLSAGDGRWRCRGAALTPCRCVTCTGTRARVTSAAPDETEGPGSPSTRACEVGRAFATAPADGSTRALIGAAAGADAAGEPATLSAGALLGVTVFVATTGSAAGASAVEAEPATAVTAGASAAVAGGAGVRDGKKTIGSTYPC